MTLKTSLPAIGSIAILAIAALLSPAAADTVRITSNDGKVSFTGTIVDVKDHKMTVQTEVGPLTIAYDAVSCDGTACPTLALAKVQSTAGASN